MRCKQFISIHILTVILNWVFVILYRMQNEDILNYPIIFVIIGLSTMVITEILSLLIPNAPRLFFGNKKAKAFRKFIKENIKDGTSSLRLYGQNARGAKWQDRSYLSCWSLQTPTRH